MEVLEIISIHCFGRKRQKTVQCLEGDESEIQEKFLYSTKNIKRGNERVLFTISEYEEKTYCEINRISIRKLIKGNAFYIKERILQLEFTPTR